MVEVDNKVQWNDSVLVPRLEYLNADRETRQHSNSDNEVDFICKVRLLHHV